MKSPSNDLQSPLPGLLFCLAATTMGVEANSPTSPTNTTAGQTSAQIHCVIVPGEKPECDYQGTQCKLSDGTTGQSMDSVSRLPICAGGEKIKIP